MEEKKLLGHPAGLFVLFFTELWERFSYYGMRAIVVLYMAAALESGGLGWSDAQTLSVYGWFGMMVYLMSIPGGFAADKWLGQKRSIMIGGFFLCAGHLLLAYPPIWAFYLSLALITIGVGLHKPNISALVGALYPDGDPAKDAGFTIFYMGINIGAFFSSIATGYAAYKYGWSYGFLIAGVGMVIGQITYLYGLKMVKNAGNKVKDTPAGAENTDKKPFTQTEKRKLGLVIFSFFIVLVFWAAFEQAGGLLNLYTERFTDRFLGGFEIPAAWFQSLNPLYITVFAPVVAAFWIFIAKRKKEPSAIAKMGLGTFILGIGFIFMVGAVMERDASSIGKSNMHWLMVAYLFHTIGELALSPVSLSFITDMAPKRMTNQVMGWYFAVTGIGGLLAAKIGIFAETSGELTVFGSIAVFTIIFGLLLMIIAPKINKIADIRKIEN